MASKKTFGAAAALAKSSVPATGDRPNVAADRYKAINSSQQNVKSVQLLVDPQECKLWERHNRNYELLNETNCDDLIQDFLSAGKQEIPAIVRRVSTKGPIKYEIVAGARRFWTVNWLRENNYAAFKFLIEVREMTDEEGFRLSNLENLARRDISDYERALDYRDALKLYYNGKQLEMAERLRKSESWMSRYLKLAELPRQIPSAYAEWGHLKLTHAPELLKILEDEERSSELLRLATELHADHSDNLIHGRKPLSGAEVFKRLKAVGETPTSRFGSGPIKSYGPAESPHLNLQRSNKSGLSVFVPKGSGAETKEVLAAFKELLSDYYKG